MADEFYARYAGVSHHDLYYQLRAGNPGQVEQLASAWKSLAIAVDDMAANLDRDLERLRSAWTGSASDEFGHRVRLVSGFARELSDEFTRTHRSLTLMAGTLRSAQARAEHPDETDDHDKLLKGAGIGLIGGPAGALIGGLIGHQQDQEEKRRAHQRMIRLVADVAAEYNVAASPMESPVTATPSELPGSASGSRVDLAAGPRAGTPATAPAAGAGGGGVGGVTPGAAPAPSAGIGVAPPIVAAGAPLEFPDRLPAGEGAGTGTSLAGAASVGAWGLGAASLVGAAGNASRPGPARVPAPTAQTAGALGSATGGYTGSRQPGHGPVMGARPGTITGTATAGATGPKGAVGSTGSAASPAKGGAAHHAPTGTAGKGAGQGGRPSATVAGAGRRADTEEDEDRLTWLTEDEMVWHDGDGPAPPVVENQ